jgi:hypothetical protein
MTPYMPRGSRTCALDGEAFLEPADLRMMFNLIVTKPRTLLGALRFLFSKGPKVKY